MNGKLCLLCCHNFRLEIEAAVSAEGWPDVAVAAFAARCGHPPLSWEELTPLLPADCTQAVILGLSCIKGLGSPPADWPAVSQVLQDNCFNLIAGNTLVAEAIERGAYLITPGWLADWRENLSRMGFKQPDSRSGGAAEFFHDFARELLLLDTGVAGDTRRQLAEFSSAVELPATRIAVGLDYVRQLLAKLVAEWRLADERQQASLRGREHARQLADHKSAMDFLGKLPLLKDEGETIAAVEEMFQMLFAPQLFYYVRFEGGSACLDTALPDELSGQIHSLRSDWAWTDSGTGFLLSITRAGEQLGVVVVDRFAFPEYRKHYLNLALSVAGVAGLAIDNARTFRRIKQIEDTLRKSERSLKIAQSMAHLGHWELTVDTGDIRCSDEMCRILGYEPGSFVPSYTAFLQAIHPEDRSLVERCIAVAREGESFDIEFRIVLPDGSVRVLHGMGELTSAGADMHSLIIGAVRDITAPDRTELLGVVQDITERKRDEDALRKTQANLITAQKLAVIGSWEWDVRNDIANWSDETYRIFGIGKSALTAHRENFLDMVLADDRERVEQALREALNGGRNYDIEYRVCQADGKCKVIHALAEVVRDEEGKPVAMHGTVQDITERKRAEDELKRYKDHLEEEVQMRTADLMLARNAAEAANRAKSVFLTSISHELRTPLNAILGFSSLLRKNQQLTRAQRESLDIINHSGEHLLAVINDVLEMSKIEAGRVVLDIAPLDLGALIRDVIDMMRVRAQEAGLQLLIEQSSGFPRYIKGDEARLRQVLINLVGNALKFTRQGGVTVRFRLKSQAQQNRMLIEVEDSGIGISAEDQQRLFLPFEQLGKHEGDNKGTGLGLTITRQFVQLMGGTISVESTPGKGSIFSVELPVEEVEASEVSEPAALDKGEIIALAPNQPEFRILIVEDQLENRLLLTHLMNNLGFAVKAAGDGRQGVELFQSWQPHLIWMDRRMPVMDGLEATKAIRSLPGGKEVKIVAVTASAFMEQRDEMLAAGMDDFVRKPFRANELYECLSKQLGVQYIYSQTPKPDESYTALTPAMLSALPADLRNELQQALESLDGERIAAVVKQVAVLDPTLHKTLSHLAENFDYPSILSVLQRAR